MKPTLTPCADCGTPVSASATACPNCGKRLKSTPGNILAIIILSVISACIAWAIISTIAVGFYNRPPDGKAGKPNKNGVYHDANGHWHNINETPASSPPR